MTPELIYLQLRAMYWLTAASLCRDDALRSAEALQLAWGFTDQFESEMRKVVAAP